MTTPQGQAPTPAPTGTPQEGSEDTPVRSQAAATPPTSQTETSKTATATLAEELADARRQAARYRRELREKETAMADLQNQLQAASQPDPAHQTALDDLTGKLTAATGQVESLTGQVKALRVQNAVLAHAGRLDIVDTDAAVRLLDQAALTFTEAGEVTGVEDALGKLVEARPWLVGGQAALATSPTNPARGTTGNAALTREQIALMSPAEINARWGEVQRALSQK